jgi:hypothetical protein
MLSPSIPARRQANRQAVFTHAIFLPVSVPKDESLGTKFSAVRIVTEHLQGRQEALGDERRLASISLRHRPVQHRLEQLHDPVPGDSAPGRIPPVRVVSHQGSVQHFEIVRCDADERTIIEETLKMNKR